MTTVEMGWAGVGRQIAEIEAARPGEYDDPTRRNLMALLDFIRKSDRPAPCVQTGYWATFNLSWNGSLEAENLIIEIFGDHYEIYRIHEGKTEIRHYGHAGEGDLPADVIDALPPPSVSADPGEENG